MFPLPSREGTESREGRRGPRSCRSRCSRFKKLKQSVRWNLTAKGAKTANKKGSVRCIFNRETRESREKFVWSASPCSYPSLCSRFIEFKGSVRSISNRERRENREQKRSVPCRSEAVPGGKERKENGVSPVVFGQAKKGVSVVFLTAKVCTVCFSSFVSFALFAVHRIQRECPLYFRREKNNRERREICEQKRECPLWLQSGSGGREGKSKTECPL